MVSRIFLDVALLGAEWVLYLLLLISVLSISLIIERFRFYKEATQGLERFRTSVRMAIQSGDWQQASRICEDREKTQNGKSPDLETGLVTALLKHRQASPGKESPDVLSEVGQDALLKTRVPWERNLALLATIGNNAPFVGLFGTVLGIIQAFHELSRQSGGTAVKSVTAGVSEALIATGVGILVAIPAVVAFNLYQRRVRASVTEAEAMKSYLIGKISSGRN